MLKKILLTASMIFLSGHADAADTGHPVVLELFTSQSCSSCPPADALLKQLSASDPDVLPLSFHVHYWDYLSWKDTYSSPVYTDRQKTYAQALGQNGVFTPQLIVNGAASVVGSNEGDVERAIATAKRMPPAVNVFLKPAGHQLIANIAANGSSVPASADIWEVQFDPYAKTHVAAGENGGRTLESINNVTSITSLGTWRPDGGKSISLDLPAGGGVAVIVQTQGQGAVLGAASYLN
jgi:hypothetical protein